MAGPHRSAAESAAPEVSPVDGLRLAARLRAALILLAGAVALGAGAELAMLRHWNGIQQVVPWLVAAGVLLGAGVLWVRRTRMTVTLARVSGAVAALGGAYGVVIHVLSNYQAGPLDRLYATTWDALPLVTRLWLAATGGTGPAPPLAPGMLALAGVCLILGSLGPLRLGGDRSRSDHEKVQTLRIVPR